jgi:hypothetical protein
MPITRYNSVKHVIYPLILDVMRTFILSRKTNSLIDNDRATNKINGVKLKNRKKTFSSN